MPRQLFPACISQARCSYHYAFFDNIMTKRKQFVFPAVPFLSASDDRWQDFPSFPLNLVNLVPYPVGKLIWIDVGKN